MQAPESETATTRPARRIKTDHRGVYYRIPASGGARAYEITYVDSDGRRRWLRVPGNLADARRALDEIRSRLAKSDRVAPTRATLADVATEWLELQSGLRPTTRASYSWALDSHVLPKLGRLRLADISTDHVAQLVADLATDGLAPWSIRACLTPLSRVFGYAARRGMISTNPVKRLERSERPRVVSRDHRVLDPDAIARVIGGASERYRPMIATAAFSGLRLGELLGLSWRDIDHEAGVIHVRHQLSARTRDLVDVKTAAARRDVVMIPALGRILAAHRLASPHSADGSLVFSTPDGRGIDQRTATVRGLRPAVAAAGLADGDSLTFHSLRHAYVSLLISQGLDVVYVSRQIGHASAATTLQVYAHAFDAIRHAASASARLEESFGSILDHSADAARGVLVTLPA